MVIDIADALAFEESLLGGKAYNLGKLWSWNLPVPPAVFIAASPSSLLSPDELKSLQLELECHSRIKGSKFFAVRSSAIGEDGFAHSYAGVFESYLDVPTKQLAHSVQLVKDSLSSKRALAYHKFSNRNVPGMGVIVQQMVHSELAGVGLTMCPVEQTHQVALIEAVAGLGDALVSGAKSPTSIRYNWRTGTFKVRRHGEDALTSYQLMQIHDLVVPALETVKSHFKRPMDVEWAISGNKVYIVQARPVTNLSLSADVVF